MAQGIIYLAKAGTGKTTFITSGLKNKLENKNVLYITYTNMNAENLKNKLQKSLINFNGDCKIVCVRMNDSLNLFL